MNIIYAESSAVLAWLLDEPKHRAVVDDLARADRVVTSALTLIECSRGLARARETKRIKPAEELAGLRLLDQAIASWDVMDISDRVSERARGAFPVEPVRTLDAIHLGTALVCAEAVGSLRMLTLDDRVRENAAELGLALLPE